MSIVVVGGEVEKEAKDRAVGEMMCVGGSRLKAEGLVNAENNRKARS